MTDKHRERVAEIGEIVGVENGCLEPDHSDIDTHRSCFHTCTSCDCREAAERIDAIYSESGSRLRKALEEVQKMNGVEFAKRQQELRGLTETEAEIWGALYMDGVSAALNTFRRALSDPHEEG